MFSRRAKTKPGFQHIFGLPIAFEISVGGVVFRRGEDGSVEYLLLHYPHGHWDYAKGHIEAGETHFEALQREITEESGLKRMRILGGFRDSVRYFYTAKGTELHKRKRSGKGIWIFKVVFFYLVESYDRQVTISDEHTGFLWLSFDEALLKMTLPSAKKLLTNANTFLKRQLLSEANA